MAGSKDDDQQTSSFNPTETSTVDYPARNQEKPEILKSSETSTENTSIPPRSLTLREALELHRPDFILRSRDRVQQLEFRVQQRKAQQSVDFQHQKKPQDTLSKPIILSTGIKKRQYTVPHPLSDNLFKPKERIISEKEMHLRSKRIYDKLPEIKRKKEEQKKKVASQTNRLRAELFKKKILDQILQKCYDC
ncbi:(E2-independent) E3 ubiquitin-conjugating enzyme FATS [Latimeria chalumnae]|uniref:(E2-independent) E3 ubiquitin-conjugating enzyme FATS n=1 Tax=Latimeria chalumnae TaxID=7897 RepID=UPI00313B144A